MMDATTIQYRLNFAHALHQVSPTLSAIHVSRAAALHPEISAVLQSSHCLKCGTYYFSGDHPSYLVGPSARKKQKRASPTHLKAFKRKCHLCGFSIDARTGSSLDHSPIPRIGAVPATPQIKEIGPESPPGIPAGTVQKTECGTVPRLPSLPKPSRAKTSTLKNMISRDRQREESVKLQTERDEGHELGLAAFLKEL